MQHDDDDNNDEDARPRLSLRTSSVSKRSPLLMLLGRYDWTYFWILSRTRPPSDEAHRGFPLYEAIWLAAIGPILDHDTMPHQHIGSRQGGFPTPSWTNPTPLDASIKLCLSRALLFFYTTGLLGHGRGRRLPFLMYSILRFGVFRFMGTTTFIMHLFLLQQTNPVDYQMMKEEAERLLAPTAHTYQTWIWTVA